MHSPEVPFCRPTPSWPSCLPSQPWPSYWLPSKPFLAFPCHPPPPPPWCQIETNWPFHSTVHQSFNTRHRCISSGRFPFFALDFKADSIRNNLPIGYQVVIGLWFGKEQVWYRLEILLAQSLILYQIHAVSDPTIHHSNHQNLASGPPDSLMISVHKGRAKVSEGPQSPPANLGGFSFKKGSLVYLFLCCMICMHWVSCLHCMWCSNCPELH